LGHSLALTAALGLRRLILRDACGTAAIVHHAVEPVALLLEAREQGAVKRASARQLHAHRVDEAAVDQNFVMDVGAGGEAG